jgi:hypothetical protein
MTLSEITAATVAAGSAAVAAMVGVINMIAGFGRGKALRKVERQTDGMAQEMATLAREAGHAKGTKEAKEAGEVKADALAEGQAQGRAERDEQVK